MFAGIISLPNTQPPVRAYLHSSGMMGAYGKDYPLKFALEYLRMCLAKDEQIYRERYSIIYPMIWANNEHRMLDVFGLKHIPHLNNPDFDVHHYCNGISCEGEALTCGDSLIVLGVEERARRKRVSLEEHIITIPTFQSNEVDSGQKLIDPITRFR